MSNCITIKEDIGIHNNLCDLAKFRAFLATVTDDDEHVPAPFEPGQSDNEIDEICDRYTAWWHLSAEDVTFGPEAVFIKARSKRTGHTFRSLRGLLKCLGRRLLADGKNLYIDLNICDTDWDDSGRFIRYMFNVRTGMQV